MHRPARILAFLAVVAVACLAGCLDGGGGDAQVVVTPAPLRPELGSARRLIIADGLLDPTVTGHAAFDPRAALDGVSIAFRRIDGGHVDFDDGAGDQQVAAFHLGYFELTQGQWTALALGAGVGDAAKQRPWRSLTPDDLAGVIEDEDRPLIGASPSLVQQVLASWNAARSAGQPTLRLPTLLEWEYASRPDVHARYTWGDAEGLHHITDHAVVHETRVARGADVVGGAGATRRLPTALGLFDLHGNVWELVDAGGGDATFVGGSWSDNLTSARLGVRMTLDRETPHALAGVRLVLVLPP